MHTCAPDEPAVVAAEKDAPHKLLSSSHSPHHSATMLAGDAVAPAGSWWGGRPGLGVETYASPEAAGAQKAAAKRLILQVPVWMYWGGVLQLGWGAVMAWASLLHLDSQTCCCMQGNWFSLHSIAPPRFLSATRRAASAQCCRCTAATTACSVHRSWCRTGRMSGRPTRRREGGRQGGRLEHWMRRARSALDTRSMKRWASQQSQLAQLPFTAPAGLPWVTPRGTQSFPADNLPIARPAAGCWHCRHRCCRPGPVTGRWRSHGAPSCGGRWCRCQRHGQRRF